MSDLMRSSRDLTSDFLCLNPTVHGDNGQNLLLNWRKFNHPDPASKLNPKTNANRGDRQYWYELASLKRYDYLAYYGGCKEIIGSATWVLPRNLD
jgi:hypothetical protein